MTDPTVPLPLRVDVPVAGHYRVKLAKGAVWSPVKLWFGPPLDPVTGEELDRSPRWQALVRGKLWERGVLDLWAWCAGQPIGENEYEYLMAIHRHASAHEPDMPEASPREAINHLTTKPIF